MKLEESSGVVTSLPIFDEIDRRLAQLAQDNFPLTRRPFAALADQLQISEDEVLLRMRRWRDSGYLREISAVLEGAVWDYDSALVAAKIPEARLDEVARVINLHPTVTHNYRRDHSYNLWFTIAVARAEGVERHVAALERLTGESGFAILRRTQTFKIGVNFDLATRSNQTSAKALGSMQVREIDAATILAMRALQTPLPIESSPFDILAETAGTDADTLLAIAQNYRGAGLRKYVATFHHRRLGVNGNGMAVWNVPDEQIARAAEILVAQGQVSHCYARNPAPGFPYQLYSMLHSKDRDCTTETARELAQKIGSSDYLVLFSSVEYKKCRLRYFLPSLEQWSAKHLFAAS